ncbi:hypothetical protein BJX70DRAFT_384034 [Aspergillus crustosus]
MLKDLSKTRFDPPPSGTKAPKLENAQTPSPDLILASSVFRKRIKMRTMSDLNHKAIHDTAAAEIACFYNGTRRQLTWRRCQQYGAIGLGVAFTIVFCGGLLWRATNDGLRSDGPDNLRKFAS